MTTAVGAELLPFHPLLEVASLAMISCGLTKLSSSPLSRDWHGNKSTRGRREVIEATISPEIIER